MKEGKPEIKEIARNIFQLRVPVPVSVEHVNLFLFTGAVPTLLDCGTNVGQSIQAILDMCEQVGVPKLEQVILSHWHVDHAGAAVALAQTGARVLISARDYKEWQEFTQPDYVKNMQNTIYNEWGLPAESYPLMQEVYLAFRRYTESPPPVAYINAAEQLQAGDYHLQPIETPGHTPGHFSFYLAELGMLFTGDQLLPNEIAYPGVWLEQNKAVSGLPAFQASLQRLEQLSATVYFPAHGDYAPNPAARCRAVQALIAQQAAAHIPAASVFAGANRLVRHKPNPGILYLQMHYIYGWETLVKLQNSLTPQPIRDS
ncbi:MAG: MBL fold metallo-hydrolase [Peptococcaceae bacterium]|nr:MBL fold metallo-hydrolase [Peptococcaceae bacterium]